jgi:hypothetical protein
MEANLLFELRDQGLDSPNMLRKRRLHHLHAGATGGDLISEAGGDLI